jgi:hypothetical protein
MANDDVGANTSGDQFWIYSAIYVAYFCGLIFVSVLLDRCGSFDHTMAKLGQSAHSAFMKYEYPKLNKNYNEPEKVPGCCSNKKVAPAPTSPNDKPEVDHSLKAYFVTWCFGKEVVEMEYNPLFVKKLLSMSAYWGINDGMVGCWKWQHGILADYVFVVFNQHKFLSLFCASKRSRLGRKEMRHAFLVQHCLAFFFAALLAGTLDNGFARIMVNIFVVIPICLIVNKLYIFLLTCPCLIREYQWCCCQIIADWLMKVGRIVAFPFVLVAICCLFLAAAFTVGDDYGAVAEYAYQVHCMSIVEELVLLSFMFRYNTYTEIKVFGITVFEFGTWFKEQVEIFDLSEEKGDYTVVETVFGRLLKIIEWKRKPGLVLPPSIDGDVEMGDMVSNKPGEEEEAKEGEKTTPYVPVVPVQSESQSESADKTSLVQPAQEVAETAGPGIVDQLKGTNKVGVEPTNI